MPHDGRLYLVLGDPGAGKDSFIYYNIHNRPFVLVQQTPNNETMDNMAYLYDSDPGMVRAEKFVKEINREGFKHDGETYYNFAIFSRTNQVDFNPKIWKIMEEAQTLWLGDVNFWVRDYQRMQRFDIFVRNIRGRDQEVWGSTHRARADVQPFVYQYAKKIYWVGPFNDDDVKLKELYGKKSADLFGSFEEFSEKIRGLKKFNALDPNPEESVLTVKDL